MITLKIALDWTPNINHIGILIAKELGFYKDKGIDLSILNPLTDNYELTPGKKLEIAEADFILAPFETVISLNNKKNVVDAVAVYAVLQEDLSSIASLKTAQLSSPKDLDGKTYASYKARYEDKIVQELIIADGGKGIFPITYPEKLGIWNTLLEGTADATWIFNNWEGVETTGKNINLNLWSMQDYGIPYGYSPVIITKRTFIATNPALCADFVKATKQGYLYAKENKEAAIAVLSSYVTEYDKTAFDLAQALEVTIPFFGDEDNCGFMQPKRVNDFLQWLVDHKLEEEKIQNQSLFTNQFLEKDLK